jgi:ankyrin repeat protein
MFVRSAKNILRRDLRSAMEDGAGVIEVHRLVSDSFTCITSGSPDAPQYIERIWDGVTERFGVSDLTEHDAIDTVAAVIRVSKAVGVRLTSSCAADLDNYAEQCRDISGHVSTLSAPRRRVTMERAKGSRWVRENSSPGTVSAAEATTVEIAPGSEAKGDDSHIHVRVGASTFGSAVWGEGGTCSVKENKNPATANGDQAQPDGGEGIELQNLNPNFLGGETKTIEGAASDDVAIQIEVVSNPVVANGDKVGSDGETKTAESEVTNPHFAKPTTFTVTLPPGVAAGQTLQALTPDGQLMSFQVPAGSTAGQTLQIAYTATAAAALPANPFILFVVPPDVVPGMTVQLSTPDGQTVQVQLPATATPGSSLQVPYMPRQRVANVDYGVPLSSKTDKGFAFSEADVEQLEPRVKFMDVDDYAQGQVLLERFKIDLIEDEEKIRVLALCDNKFVSALSTYGGDRFGMTEDLPMTILSNRLEQVRIMCKRAKIAPVRVRESLWEPQIRGVRAFETVAMLANDANDAAVDNEMGGGETKQYTNVDATLRSMKIQKTVELYKMLYDARMPNLAWDRTEMHVLRSMEDSDVNVGIFGLVAELLEELLSIDYFNDGLRRKVIDVFTNARHDWSSDSNKYPMVTRMLVEAEWLALKKGDRVVVHGINVRVCMDTGGGVYYVRREVRTLLWDRSFLVATVLFLIFMAGTFLGFISIEYSNCGGSAWCWAGNEVATVVAILSSFSLAMSIPCVVKFTISNFRLRTQTVAVIEDRKDLTTNFRGRGEGSKNEALKVVARDQEKHFRHAWSRDTKAARIVRLVTTTVSSAAIEVWDEFKRASTSLDALRHPLRNMGTGSDIDACFLGSIRVLVNSGCGGTDAEILVNSMLDAGASADAQHALDGRSALMIAVNATRIDLATVLLKNGADVNLPDNTGSTPLNAVVRLLRRKNGPSGANHNVLSVARMLVIDAGADVRQPDRNGEAPLHFCAYTGHAGGASLLLKHGADINCGTLSGMTPLGLAARGGFVDVVKILLTEGKAAINQASENGCTPLHWAIVDPVLDLEKDDRIQLIQFLLQSGSDVDAVGWIGAAKLNGTPLMCAAAAQNNVTFGVFSCRNTSAVQRRRAALNNFSLELLAHGADVLIASNQSHRSIGIDDTHNGVNTHSTCCRCFSSTTSRKKSNGDEDGSKKAKRAYDLASGQLAGVLAAVGKAQHTSGGGAADAFIEDSLSVSSLINRFGVDKKVIRTVLRAGGVFVLGWFALFVFGMSLQHSGGVLGTPVPFSFGGAIFMTVASLLQIIYVHNVLGSGNANKLYLHHLRHRDSDQRDRPATAINSIIVLAWLVLRGDTSSGFTLINAFIQVAAFESYATTPTFANKQAVAILHVFVICLYASTFGMSCIQGGLRSGVHKGLQDVFLLVKYTCVLWLALGPFILDEYSLPRERNIQTLEYHVQTQKSWDVAIKWIAQAFAYASIFSLQYTFLARKLAYVFKETLNQSRDTIVTGLRIKSRALLHPRAGKKRDEIMENLGEEVHQNLATHLPQLEQPSKITPTNRNIAVTVLVLVLAYVAFAVGMIANVPCPVATNTTDVFDGCLTVGYPMFRVSGSSCPCLAYKCEKKPLTKDNCLKAAVKQFGDKVKAVDNFPSSYNDVPKGCSVRTSDSRVFFNTYTVVDNGDYTVVHQDPVVCTAFQTGTFDPNIMLSLEFDRTPLNTTNANSLTARFPGARIIIGTVDSTRDYHGRVSAGSLCSSGSQCTSGVCRGNNCCGAKGRSTGCTDCDFDGDCSTCASEYTKKGFQCYSNFVPSAASCKRGETDCFCCDAGKYGKVWQRVFGISIGNACYNCPSGKWSEANCFLDVSGTQSSLSSCTDANFSFSKTSGKYCSNNTGSYTTLSSAESACNSSSSCTAVYDSGCDGQPYKLCTMSSYRNSTAGSCVYKKNSSSST